MQSIPLTDRFGRQITYLRLSVTDRCDFRCTYCMAEDMVFMPRSEVLSLEELALVAETFIELGIKKIRVTGGEPLVRKNVIELLQHISSQPELHELCLTTNGSQLENMAEVLKRAGVNRINVSLDSLQASRFKSLTRHGELDTVLAGLDKAVQVGFDQIKINSVILKHFNFDEICDLTEFALNRGIDISFIEEMPLGTIHSHSRELEFVSSEELRHALSAKFQLSPSEYSSGGPARFWRAQGYNNLVGFISPHSENFCATCNRVRVTATGRLLLCLGNEHSIDLKKIMRTFPASQQKNALKRTIVQAMTIKPEKHEFDLAHEPQILRFMSATGG